MLQSGMTYSLDLRQRVLKFVTDGGTMADAGRIFAVHHKTVYCWLKSEDLRPKSPPKSRNRKLNQQAIFEHVKKHPEMILRDRAKHFGVTNNAIWYQFKKLGITLKKNDKIQGEKVRSTYKIPANSA